MIEESIGWLQDRRILFSGSLTQSRLKPGDIVTAGSRPNVESYSSFFNGYELCGIGAFSFTHSVFPIDTTIGRYCSISWNVSIPGPNHPIHLLSSSAFLYDRHFIGYSQFVEDTGGAFDNYQDNPQKAGVEIGHDVWIGQDVMIMRGIKIGNGAVLAAGSVITKDVPPYAIMGGNPARLIRYRFDQADIDALQELQWWRFPFTELNRIDLSAVSRSISSLQAEIGQMSELPVSFVDFSALPGEPVPD